MYISVLLFLLGISAPCITAKSRMPADLFSSWFHAERRSYEESIGGWKDIDPHDILTKLKPELPTKALIVMTPEEREEWSTNIVKAILDMANSPCPDAFLGFHVLGFLEMDIKWYLEGRDYASPWGRSKELLQWHIGVDDPTIGMKLRELITRVFSPFRKAMKLRDLQPWKFTSWKFTESISSAIEKGVPPGVGALASLLAENAKMSLTTRKVLCNIPWRDVLQPDIINSLAEDEVEDVVSEKLANILKTTDLPEAMHAAAIANVTKVIMGRFGELKSFMDHAMAATAADAGAEEGLRELLAHALGHMVASIIESQSKKFEFLQYPLGITNLADADPKVIDLFKMAAQANPMVVIEDFMITLRAYLESHGLQEDFKSVLLKSLAVVKADMEQL